MCGPASGSWPEPRLQVGSTTQVAPAGSAGAVQVRWSPATESVRSTWDAGSSSVLVMTPVAGVADVAGDPVRLDGHQRRAGHAGLGLGEGLGQRGVVRRPGSDLGLTVHQLGAGGGIVRGDRRDGGRPRRADGDVDLDVALRGAGQGGLDAGHPRRRCPTRWRHVDLDVAGPEAVGHVGDLEVAEARVGDLVDLAGDLGRVDEAVRPPPAEPGGGGRRGLAEQLLQVLRETGRRCREGRAGSCDRARQRRPRRRCRARRRRCRGGSGG